jgi:hypothetical protein
MSPWVRFFASNEEWHKGVATHIVATRSAASTTRCPLMADLSPRDDRAPHQSPRDESASHQFVSAHAVTFTTAAGEAWSVREVAGNHIAGAVGASCLVFASLEAMRRVRIYPADWAALSSAELLELSWGR